MIALVVGILILGILIPSGASAINLEVPKFKFDPVSSQVFGVTLKLNEYAAKINELYKKIEDLKKAVIIHNTWEGALTEHDILKLKFLLNQVVDIRD